MEPEAMRENIPYQGPAFWSYGFRPFFLSAALFAGIAVPIWVLILTGTDEVTFRYPPREWHVHEMVFGFLPCVITGFLLTAIPNWTDRSPIRGMPLMLLLTVWIAGRLAIAIPWFPPLASAIVDGAFLIVVAGIVFREIAAGRVWDRLPMGVLISLYAGANILFHVLYLNRAATDLAERMALTLIMILLAMIGGKITPSFTEDVLAEEGVTKQPAAFSLFDGISILLVGVAGILWMINLNSTGAGVAFVAAGTIHLIRLSRWYGWLTWRKLSLDLTRRIWLAGYGVSDSWRSILGIGVHQEDAVHALTTGAVGVMTLAVMTRASLGHTGRTKHAGPLTVIIYLLVNLGAIFRVFGSSLDLSGGHSLALAAGCWSGAYLLFAIGYGHILFGQSVEEE